MKNNIDELINKVDNLSPDKPPLWGTMTAQKMVEHLIYAFKGSNGKISIKCYSDERKLPVLKRILKSDRPMPKNFDSPANRQVPPDYQYESLEAATKQLRTEVTDFYKYFEENPTAVLMNPTFGILNKEEWFQFHKKHLTHHLSQFGLLK